MFLQCFQLAIGARSTKAPRTIGAGMSWTVTGSLLCNRFEIIKVHPGSQMVDILARNSLTGNQLVLNRDWNEFWSEICSSIPKHLGRMPQYSGRVDVSAASIDEALKYRGINRPRLQ